ncbi:hypothetical protein CSC74_11790 [Pseudoxanthomonas yeongjuensis]|uniref:putative peptide modification system cyclase n=1 Tax=Pseudoxanthomonas yeongjuensis TaxID=377616 RepID=UPI001390B49B|nr:putative peptide modification system cyclase [Pseudoxanthomonas yeongjuensis]KAF1716492.1 hypothetical protein CSC74_11790 [Pseudoxanthomonas yeongjuensis]
MNDFFRTPSEGPQLRTLLLTDLVDSTGLVERLGDTAGAELFREHDQLVLKLQQQWRGRLIDRSDGLLLLFERPVDGLGFALDYTRGLRDLGKARKVELLARAGLHVGEVLTWKNSDAAVQVGAKPLEVEGLAKPMAARLMTLARPGQILLSSVAEPLTRRASRELGERGKNLLWKSYGRWRFKGVPQAQEIHEVGEVGLAPLRMPSHNPKAWRDIPLWRRPAALVAEVALLAGLGIGAWFLGKPQPAIAFAERDWVVVGDLRNLTGEQVLDDSLQQAFRISLEQSRYVNLLSDMKARDTLARMQRQPGTLLDRATASEIAIRDGARAVILPTVSEVGGRVRFSAEVIDPHTQTTVYAESADGVGVGSALDSIDKVAGTLRGKLGEALASVEKDSEPLPQVTTRNLDALRAYALAQKAYGHGDYKEAMGYYERAVNLDGKFALAHMGVLRAYNAMQRLPEGLPSLRRAHALRDRLPAREQLYLDAWIAQVDAPDKVYESWMQMSNLYPEYFPAAANVGYSLEVLNRYSEAVPYVTRATSPKYEFAPLAAELLGRMKLALGNYAEADKAFGMAIKSGLGSSKAWRAAGYAAQERFDEAERAWPRPAEIDSGHFERVSIYLDQGKWDLAIAEARQVESTTLPGTSRFREGLFPLAVAQWAKGDHQASLATLETLSALALKSLESAQSNTGARDDASLAAYAGLLAQRMGNGDIAAKAIRGIQKREKTSSLPPVGSLLQILMASEPQRKDDPSAVIAELAPLVDGNELFQTHVVLLETYADAGSLDKALVEARWLTVNRGRAYSEFGGCKWCQQALNVTDARMASLRAAELLSKQSRPAEARRELASFDRHWPVRVLPDQLRLRRTALEGTFK